MKKTTGRFKSTAGATVMPRIDFSKSRHLEYARELVSEYEVGGFIVFNGEMEQVREAICELNGIAGYPLIFGCDAERGLGQIVKGGTLFPFLMAQGAACSPKLLRSQAEITAREMRYCGFNLLFAPVLDVNSDPLNPIINIRAFGDNVEIVSKLGVDFIKSVQKSGLACCAKHFPGHGGCRVDSHVEMPVVTTSEAELLGRDVYPFRHASDNGVMSIMLAHVNYCGIDNENIPATVSTYLIKDILRDKTGFKGLIISDSFRMGALEYLGDEPEVAKRALAAGCDIILDPKDPVSLLEGLYGEIESSSEFRESVEKRAGNFSDFRYKVTASNRSQKIKRPTAKKTAGVIDDISKRSVCRLKGNPFESKRVNICFFDISDMGEGSAIPFINKLEENGVEISSLLYINPLESRELPALPDPDTACIFIVFTSVRAWAQYSTVPQGYQTFIDRCMLSGAEKAVVVFGSPYVVRNFSGCDIKIVNFDVLPECQSGAASVLLGELEPKGKIPVTLDPV